MPVIKTPPATGCITTTTGTGSYALGAALTMNDDTLITFSGAQANGWIADGDLVYYAAKNASGAWEFGIGTYNHGAQTLARTTILKSTNGNAAVSWGAGDKSLYCAYPPEQILLAANNGSEIGITAPGLAVIQAATVALQRTALDLIPGTAANDIVRLDGTAKLPAVDGSQLTNLPSGPIPAGTVMLFYQAAAPSGWTRVTSVNDKIPIILGSGGSPGTVNSSDWNVTQLTCSSVALALSQIPAHTHTITYGVAQQGSPSANVVESIGTGSSSANTGSAGTGGGHAHDIIPGGWRPPGAFMLMASKN